MAIAVDFDHDLHFIVDQCSNIISGQSPKLLPGDEELMPKIGLLGSTGQLGRRLFAEFASLGEVIAPSRQQLDASDPDSVQQWLQSQDIDLLVNAIAMTGVDQAESCSELAAQLNQHFVRQLAEYAAAHQIWLVHFSTDYVFDGTGDKPWQETDPCQPLQQYGLSKRAGELAIMASGCKHLIFRTSWLYDSQGQNFLRTMLRLAQQQTAPEQSQQQCAVALKIVADQIGAPTFAAELALIVRNIVGQLLTPPTSQAQPVSGIYHLCAAGFCSWFDFASAIFVKAKSLDLLEDIPEVVAIGSADLIRAAARPKNSRLDTSKVQITFNLQLTNWQQQLAQCLELLKNPAKTGK